MEYLFKKQSRGIKERIRREENSGIIVITFAAWILNFTQKQG